MKYLKILLLSMLCVMTTFIITPIIIIDMFFRNARLRMLSLLMILLVISVISWGLIWVALGLEKNMWFTIGNMVIGYGLGHYYSNFETNRKRKHG